MAKHAQPDNGQPASRLRHCVHLCAGTGIVSVRLSSLTYCCPSPLHPTHPPPTLHPLPHSLPAQCTMAATHDYSVVMVDDGAGGPDRLIQYNPYWRTRPKVNPERPWSGPRHELDHLSSVLQGQGRAEGGNNPRKLVLLEQSTSTLDPHQMRAPSVVLLDTSCRTRSCNSQARHQRNENNCYLGTTDDALQDDTDLVKQLELLQEWQSRQEEQGQPFIFTIENPRATIEKHPLVRECVLKPRAEGGLGGTACHFDTCWFSSSASKVHKKPEVLFTNNKLLIQDFAKGKYLCKKHPCPRRQDGLKHDKLEGACCTAAAAQPRQLADHLARLHALEETRLRNAGASMRQHCGAAPVSPREILLEAARAADKAVAKAAPAAATFAADYVTYEQVS